MIQSLEFQIEQMKDKVRELAGLEDKMTEQIDENTKLKDKVHHTETELHDLKRYAHELLEKVKKDSEALEFMVDRRMINKFLINYANPSSS